MKMCIICGYPVPEDCNESCLTCGDRCLNELKDRQEIAKAHRREMQEHKEKNYRAMSETICVVVGNFARVLLEQDIPSYISNADIDREICKQDEWFNKLNQSYRRRCITNNIGTVGYVVNSTTSRGKKVFKLVEDRNILRARLVEMTQ